MVNGLLLLNKPKGITSHDLVNKARNIFNQRRIGHTGILDPMATGVMILLLGRGTLLSSYLTRMDKKYSAVFSFGKTIDSFDSEGKIVNECDPGQVSLDKFKHLINTFVGKIKQLIPPYSAAKINGSKMYKSARKGKTLPEKYKDVEIYSIGVSSFDWPEVCVEVHCGSGTYVRSIAHEMGQRLGCGGYLKQLVRTAVGAFTLEQTVTVDELKNLIDNGDFNSVKPLIDALPEKPTIAVRPEYYRYILEGRPFIKRYLQQTEYQGPGGCLSLLLGPENKILALANLNYNWGSINHLNSHEVLGKYVRIVDEGHLRQKRT